MAHPEKKKTRRTPKKAILRRLAVMLLRTGMAFFLLFFLLISLLYFPPVQKWITGKVEQFLTEKFSAKVEIGAVHLNFAAQLIVRDLYIEDQQQDTLWNSEIIYLDIPVYPLFKQQLLFNHVDFRGVKSKYVIFKVEADSTNSDFIINAFGGGSNGKERDNNWKIDASAISLRNIDFLYDDRQNASQVHISLGSLEIASEHSDFVALNFHLSKVQLQNTTVTLKNGMAETSTSATNSTEADISSTGIPLFAKVDQVALENCTVNYSGPTADENRSLQLGEVKLKDFVLDGAKSQVQTESFSIIGGQLAVATLSSGQDTTEITEPLSLDFGWKVNLHVLKLEDNSFFFHQKTLGDTLSDFALDVSKIDIVVANMSLSHDTLHANIEQLAFYEQKGIQVQECNAALFVCNEKLDIQDLKIKTPHSEISASFAAQNSVLFSQALAELHFTAQLHPSTIGRHDLQYFMPAEVAQFPDINLITLEADIEGSINDMTIHHFQTNLDQEVFLGVSGKLQGLPDLEKTRGEIDINAHYLSQKGLKKILVQELPFDRNMLPDFLTFKGRVEGAKDNFTSNLHLNSSVGKVDGLVTYRNIPAKKDTFQCTLAFADFDPEKIYPAAAISNMAGKLEVSASGLMNQQYVVQSTLKADSLTYDNYNYQNITLQAQYKQQEGFAQLQMDDSNLQLSGEGHWKTKDTVQQTEVNLNVHEADLYALHLTDAPFSLQGQFSSQMTFAPRSFQLVADLKDMIVEKETPYRVKDLHLTSRMQDDFFDTDIHSQFFQGSFESNIHPAEFSPLLVSHFRSYLSKEANDSLTTAGYYRLKLSFDERSAIEKLLPEVEAMDITTLESTFDAAQKDFQFIMDIPYIRYAGIEADSLEFDIRSDQKSLAYRVHIPSVGKDSLYFKNLSFSGDLSEGKLINQISLTDSLKKDQYKIGFLLEGIKEKGITFSLIPGQTLLNYDRWTVGGDNQVIFKQDQPSEGSLMITHERQALGIQLTPADVQIHITDLPLELFSELVHQQGNTPLLSGWLNGNATIQRRENFGQTAVEMSISDCKVMNTNLGYIEFSATSLPDDKLEGLFSLKNENNTAIVRGSYAYGEETSPLTLQFNMDCRDLSVFQSFANGEITDLNGQIVSKISATGNLDNINANGHITFQDASFQVKQLNNRFQLVHEAIILNQTGLRFNNFTLQDVNKNQFIIDGDLMTQDYQHLNVDLNISGNKFTLLNSTSADNPEFFGVLVMSAKAQLQGQLPDLRINADLSVDEGTSLTYVMPPSEINMISDEGIVEFVDPTGTLPSDALDIQRHISTSLLTPLSGLNVEGNLSIDKNAAFRIDIDPRSGDYTIVNGEGTLNIGITKGQNLSVTGTYAITQGIYEVSFYNLAKKNFQIEEGSRLSWTGDPYNPIFDIRAYNVIRTASTGLVSNEIAGLSDEAKRTYQKPLPYEVKIFIQGNPLSTDLGFSIDLPDEEKLPYPVIASKLQRLNEKGNESLLTQQVFGLLTIGSFIPERSTDVTGDYSVAFASTAAVNSLNGILTNELNKLSSQYLKGIQVDFGLQSSQDLSSGNQGVTTMMDIKVSKTLFNERVVLEAKSSFDVEGNSNYSSTQNDIAIVYDLTEKGDYKLKAFNISSYDVVYKDIRTSGISLIFVKEYDPVKKPQNKKKDKRKVRDGTKGISKENSN